MASDLEIIVKKPRRTQESDVALLSYLEALTHDFVREGQQVSCVLTYAEPDPERPGVYHAVVAQDTGYEGIACVDDTARAALLALGIFERSGSRQALSLAKRWLTFVTYMQYPDGQFANFIRNAAGVRNASGPTSHVGGYWWSVRALWALARAYRVTGDRAYRDHYEACRLAPIPDGKIQALQTLAELELFQREPSDALRASILDHCATIIGDGSSPYFVDHPDQKMVSLWGYHQLHAVAGAASQLGRTDLLKPCRSTVNSLLEGDVRDRFWYSFPDRQKNGVCAYCITPIVQGLAAMYRATEAKRYRQLALDGTAWFYGRNDASTAMYGPTTGRCRDGITDGIASRNCGAESSIEAGMAEVERRDLMEAP